MTKKKSAKRAFISSFMSFIMCFAMLAGTTFAWYTDSVTSSGNKIIAGTLDIQLWKYDGNEYVDISASTAPIFQSANLAQNNTETLWEPGKTQIAYLKIKNGGNLWLKYQVALRVNNVTKNLDRAMLYKIVEAEAPNGVTAWDATGASSVAANTTTPAVLGPDEVYNFALVIHMDENAGNEYMGGEIDFDITVLATQYTKEEDSFGPNYDANAADGIATAYATYSAGEKTVLETGDTNEVGNAKVTIPATATTSLENGDGVNLLVVETDTPANFAAISEDNGTTTYEVSLETDSGAAITSTGDAFKVELNIGVVDLQQFVHNNIPMTRVNTSVEDVNADGEYYYDVTTGIVTFMTKTFSPFTSEYKFSGGLGTKAYPYLIANADDMQAISAIYGQGYKYYKWIGGTSLNCSNWTAVNIEGSFDGNGVVFNNLDQQLFRSVGKASTTNTDVYTLENFTVNANININGYGAAVIRQAGNNLVMKNVTVHGTIQGNNGAASFVCFGPGNISGNDGDGIQPMQWSFINCVSNATIIATGDMGVAFVKHPYCWASQQGGNASAQAACLITIEDSIFTGDIIAAGTSEYKAKYFVGNANDMLVKTTYSADFVAQYGNPEGVSYAQPTAKTEDGIFFVGNYPGEGKKVSGYSNYGTCMDKYRGSVSAVTVTAGQNPAKGEVFTVTKLAGATEAKVNLEIAPNDENGYGSYLGTYMSETLNISAAEGTFTTDTIKYFDITINGTATTGLNGNTFNVANASYGTTYNAATVRVTQYNANGDVLGVITFNIKG